LRVKAPKKNNYDICFKFTDENGEFPLTENEIKDEISWTQKAFIMDYQSTYDECSSNFSIILFSQEGLEKAIKAHENYQSFGEKIINNLSLLRSAINQNMISQEWHFNLEDLELKKEVVRIDCLVSVV
jgi:hypothetical protein